MAGFGQSGTLKDNGMLGFGTLNNDSIVLASYWYFNNSKQIRDTIPVLIVFAESPSRITVSEVKYMMGYLVREQNGYYDATVRNRNGFTNSTYTPSPLMITIKYLDGNRLDIPSSIHVLMSKEIK